jgi:hypothetical protein
MTGGSGSKTNPYFSSDPKNKACWQYFYAPSYTYVDECGTRIFPTSDQIEAGFLHVTGGVYYRTTSQLTGAKALAAQIKVIEDRIASDTQDLAGLRKAEKLLTDNPEYMMLLDLHKKGLL